MFGGMYYNPANENVGGSAIEEQLTRHGYLGQGRQGARYRSVERNSVWGA